MFYATLKSNSSINQWVLLNAKTLVSAKREATHKFDHGFIGDVIHLIEVDNFNEAIDFHRMPYTKEINHYSKWSNPY